MESITKCLATNIRNLRKEQALTQSELAEKAGLSVIFVQGIESEKKWLSPMTAQAIAKAFQVHESKLFENCFEKHEKQSAPLSKMKSIQRSKIPRNAKLSHIPEDIFQALSTTCRHPQWKWEIFRWILEGYHRDSVLKA